MLARVAGRLELWRMGKGVGCLEDGEISRKRCDAWSTNVWMTGRECSVERVEEKQNEEK
jgi:hypothetical protein